MTFDWNFLVRHLPDFVPAVGIAVQVFVISAVLGTVWGIVIALGRMSHIPVLRGIASAYIELYRNTPLLIQLYFVFFGLPLAGIRLPPITSAVVALVMQHGAFFAEIVRGAIRNISQGQYDAGTALGMTRGLLLRQVILPQAIRDAAPAAGNQLVIMLQDTSLASTIGVMEVTLTGSTLAGQAAASFEMFIVVGAVYLLLTTVLGGAIRLLETRYRVLR